MCEAGRRSGWLLVLVLAVAAGCSDDPSPAPEGSGTQIESPQNAERTKAPRWRTKYSAEQLAAYRQASKRWRDYIRRSAPVWAKGRVTSEAEAVFEDFFLQPELMARLLASYEKKDITVQGTPLVLDSRPVQVQLDQDPVTVVLRQCIDPRPVQLMAAGQLVSDPDQTPVVRRIVLSRVAGGPYQVVRYKGPETGDEIDCR